MSCRQCTRLNLIDDDDLDPQLKWWPNRHRSQRYRIAKNEEITIQGVISLVAQIRDLQVQTWLSIVKTTGLIFLLRTKYIYQCISSTFPIDHKLGPKHSALDATLEAGRAKRRSTVLREEPIYEQNPHVTIRAETVINIPTEKIKTSHGNF